MQILMERLKSMGINDPTEEQKEQQHIQIIEELKFKESTQKKRKWENMNFLAKELREIVV